MTAREALFEVLRTTMDDKDAMQVADAYRAEVLAAEYRADGSRLRKTVLAEVWEAMRDADGGPLIEAMQVINKLINTP